MGGYGERCGVQAEPRENVVLVHFKASKINNLDISQLLGHFSLWSRAQNSFYKLWGSPKYAAERQSNRN